MQLPDVAQLFARFDSDAGSDAAARARFENFVTDLVKVRTPSATTVAGPGNRDWGLDTFAGQLAGGSIVVWQSKYVRNWQDDSPQSQIRESFDSAIKNAAKNGYSVSSWTLVVPSIPSPDQRKWFDGWAKRNSTPSIKISLWDGTELRYWLLAAEAEAVRREYFPHTVRDAEGNQTAEVAEISDAKNLDHALFVKQLHEAGHIETDAARAHYFAADALHRDLTAKGAKARLGAFNSFHTDVHGVWEDGFNASVESCDSAGRMGSLFREVMTNISNIDDISEVKLANAHRRGAMHRLVEQSKAGWVRDWRQVSDLHRDASGSTSRATAEGVE